MGSSDALAGVGSIFEGVAKVNHFVFSGTALILDHNVAGLDVPVIVAESLHFSKEADHFVHEFPKSFLVVCFESVIGNLFDFLVESLVTQLHDDAHFKIRSFIFTVPIRIIIVEDLNDGKFTLGMASSLSLVIISISLVN